MVVIKYFTGCGNGENMMIVKRHQCNLLMAIHAVIKKMVSVIHDNTVYGNCKNKYRCCSYIGGFQTKGCVPVGGGHRSVRPC